MSENKEETENIDLENAELQNALHILKFTNKSLYLTGKAGTGKSTFLRYIAKNIGKKNVVLAPTGIAAINAGGATLHSFFNLPFHPLLPGDAKYSIRNIRKTLKFKVDKIKLIKELELIIIDEISMVRADIIDFIDHLLRIYCQRMREPFGGKQLLLVGDIYQLEPVVKEEDRQMLSNYYSSAFFFNAKVFSEFQLVSIELTKNYRQNDQTFINLLDNIRLSNATDSDLAMLNRQVVSSHRIDQQKDDPNSPTFEITLATRRDTVDNINSQHLATIPGEPILCSGTIQGEFPESALPTLKELLIKVGAQVLFVKNDINHRWVNGTLGKITDIDMENGYVIIQTENGQTHNVEQEHWENIKYTFNKKENKIEETVLGTYTQFPIKLAWAITVHKCQGLTFNKVKIDFSGGVFAAGQTYVALSRCTSLEGISLTAPIGYKDIFVHKEVVNFSKTYNNSAIISNALKQSEADMEYRQALLAFNRGDMETSVNAFSRALQLRNDIGNPLTQRLIRRKLNIVNQLKKDNEELKKAMAEREKSLQRFAVEYLVMGKECEEADMNEAALRNYEKALMLCPDLSEAKERIEKLNPKQKKK